MSSQRLQGRIAIVTGSSQGIGREICNQFSIEGAFLVCADLKPLGQSEEIATHEWISQKGGKAIFVEVDVSKAKSWKAVIAKTVETYGKLDIVVNNAGICSEANNPQPIDQVDEDAFDAHMRINARGVFLGSKYSVQQFLKQEPRANGMRGWIVNFASMIRMSGPTSLSLALAVLVLLPFDILTWVLRFYVRVSRKAWGPDDWSMVIAIPLFTISTIGMLGIAFTGGGKIDTELTTEQRETAMFWWFIMQTMFCLAAIPVKWAICFTLLRIAEKRKAYQWSIYAIMTAVFLVMASTTVYEFFHCTPIEMNWKAVEGGSCKAQSNITGFSFALSAVSIFSDWFCALIPIPLLWHVQIDTRVKCSIIALLGLGIFASTAAIVRLTVTINLSATTDFLHHAMPVAAWAHAELGLGVILANLPALRPLLEKLLSLRSTLRSSGKRGYTDPKIGDRYLELEEGMRSRKSTQKGTMMGSNKGTETRIYGGDLADSNSSLGDDRSTKHIVQLRADASGIQVDHQIRISHDDAKI